MKEINASTVKYFPLRLLCCSEIPSILVEPWGKLQSYIHIHTYILNNNEDEHDNNNSNNDGSGGGGDASADGSSNYGRRL